MANELLEEAVAYGCSHIIFEDLTHIRETIPQATWQHVWAFRRLFQYVEYKAAEHGIESVQVPPKHTSQRCSTCGCTHEDNRDGEDFECLNCGYQNHADYNAAKNVGYRYLRRRQNAADGGAPVDVRLNRGTLNVSGEYVPPATADGGCKTSGLAEPSDPEDLRMALNGSPRESPPLNERGRQTERSRGR